MSILQLPKNSAGALQKLFQVVRNMVVLEKWLGIYLINGNEIDDLYSSFGKDRKYLAKQSLTTYTNWSHVQAFNSYSIWKHAVSTYLDNTANMLYVDTIDDSINNVLPQIMDYEGAASSETASYFGYLYYWNGSIYSSNYGDSGGDLSSEGGSSQTILANQTDFFYVGDSAQFEGITLSFQTYALGATLDIEYWNGSAWTAMSLSVNDLVDNTSDFASNGTIIFTAPGDWATTIINSQTKYWIRISTSSSITVDPVAYAALPSESVVTLLRLGAQQIRQEQWAWCYYNGYIYVTIPNNGKGSFEGIQWIDSNSSTTNLENFFTYRNQYKTRYADSGYPAAITGRVGSSTFNSTTGRVLTHSIGDTNYIVQVTPTANPGAGFYFYVTKANDTATIYTNSGVSSTFDFRISRF